MATSSSSSSSDYCFFNKFVTRIKANEYFKSKSIGKTTQLHGWQTTKCEICDNLDGHKMNSALR